MPLIFHFKAEKGLDDYSLKPAGYERLASPLILRPYRHASDKYGCLALILPGDPMAVPLQLVNIKQSAMPPWSVDGRLTPQEAHSKKSPLRGNPDPLAAFLSFFRMSLQQETIS